MKRETEKVQCPECKVKFSIRPTESADEFKCPRCEKGFSLGALRYPDSSPNAVEVFMMKSQAAAANLWEHTVAYVYTRPDGKEDAASGTLVRIGDRFLLATVRHSKPAAATPIQIVGRAPILSRNRSSHVVNRVVHPAIDVAALEIDPSVPGRLGIDPIDVDRIHDAGTGIPDASAKLIGFPGGYTKKLSQGIAQVTRFNGMSYGCETIAPLRWPAMSKLKVNLTPGENIAAKYSRDVVGRGPVHADDGMPDPPGMSGGGLWQRKRSVSDDEIWTAEDLCLIGVQSEWFCEIDYLKIIQVIHWLKLVADSYDDLAPGLIERFPRLSEIE